jgi:hypothetical protein
MGLVDENVPFLQKPKNPEKAVPYTQLVLRNQKSKVTDPEGNPIFKQNLGVHPLHPPNVLGYRPGI